MPATTDLLESAVWQEWPYLAVRMPTAAQQHDHLVVDGDAAGALAGDRSEIPAMCGRVIVPLVTAMPAAPLCPGCLDLPRDSATRAARLYARDAQMAAEARRIARRTARRGRRLRRWRS